MPTNPDPAYWQSYPKTAGGVTVVTWQCIEDPFAQQVVVSGSAPCPNCGAVVSEGMSRCAYCRTPVALMGFG